MANINEPLYDYWKSNPKLKALRTVGETTLIDADGEIVTSLGGGGGGAGGGSIVYTNAAGDFVATPTNAARTITITGLAFTLEAKHVVAGSIIKIASDGTVEAVDTTSVSVTAGVITLANAEDTFVTADELYVTLIGPDKWYDLSQDSAKVIVQNPLWAHYTDVENIISASNLGITGTADGTSASTILEDTGAAFATTDVAVGFLAYSEEEDQTSVVTGVTSGTICATDASVTDWDGDTYWLPECQRTIINAEGYNHLTIHTRLATTAIGNSAFIKIYGTLDADAVATDDTYWVDLSTDIFKASHLTCSGASGTQEGLYFVDTPTGVLKYMIKIVGEVNDNGAGAIGAQAFDVYIKKYS